MKLNELLNILDENMEIWINCYDHAKHYDGRNSIDERYNSMYVGYITQDANGVLTIEMF